MSCHFQALPKKPLEVADAIAGRLRELGWTEENDIDQFTLAIQEGLVNAAKHGNRYDSHKKVTVEVNLTHDEAWVTISDEGKGFDQNKVPDPTTQEGLLETHGRGVLIMGQYAELEIIPNQGKIILHRKRIQETKKDQDAADHF